MDQDYNITDPQLIAGCQQKQAKSLIVSTQDE